MKKFVLAALAASILAGPIAIEPATAQQRDRHGPVVRQQPARAVATRRVVETRRAVARPASHRWAKGQRFDRRYANNYQEIRDWRTYRGRRLYAPPRGYHWVRSGNDAVLVAVTGGLIGAVLAGAFN